MSSTAYATDEIVGVLLLQAGIGLAAFRTLVPISIMTLGFASYESAATRLTLPCHRDVNELSKVAALAAENQPARVLA